MATPDADGIPLGAPVSFVDYCNDSFSAAGTPTSASTVTVVTPASWVSYSSPASHGGGLDATTQRRGPQAAASDVKPERASGDATHGRSPALEEASGGCCARDTDASRQSMDADASSVGGSPHAGRVATPECNSPGSPASVAASNVGSGVPSPPEAQDKLQDSCVGVVDLCSPTSASPSPQRTIRRKRRTSRRAATPASPAAVATPRRLRQEPCDSSSDDDSDGAVDILAIKQHYKTPRSHRRRRLDRTAVAAGPGSVTAPKARTAPARRAQPSSGVASARRRRRAVVDSSDDDSDDDSGDDSANGCGCHGDTHGAGQQSDDSDAGADPTTDAGNASGSPAGSQSEVADDSDDGMSDFIVNDSDVTDPEDDSGADSDWRGSGSDDTDRGGVDSDADSDASSSTSDASDDESKVARRPRKILMRRGGIGAPGRPALPPRTPRAPRTPRRDPTSARTAGRHARVTPRQFKAQRGELAAAAYREFNAAVFDNQLPDELTITWNARLRKTAGVTHMARNRGGQRMAKVELSGKVLDCEDRLRTVRIHRRRVAQRPARHRCVACSHA